jgi:hypothetical protein
VELRGIAKGGAVPAAIFTLPAGYRPVGVSSIFAAVTTYTGAAYSTGVVQVSDAGVLTVSTGLPSNTATAWVALDLEFATDQATFPTGPTGPQGPSGAPTWVTSLPGSPTDGQEVYYLADAARGVGWHLRYRSGATRANKWEFLGGAPLHARYSSQYDEAAGTYQTIISVVAPLAGFYMVTLSAVAFNNTASAAWLAAPKFGTAATDDTYGVLFQNPAGAHTIYSTGARTVENPSALTAGATVALQFRRGVGGTARLHYADLSITPVAVG